MNACTHAHTGTSTRTAPQLLRTKPHETCSTEQSAAERKILPQLDSIAAEPAAPRPDSPSMGSGAVEDGQLDVVQPADAVGSGADVDGLGDMTWEICISRANLFSSMHVHRSTAPRSY